METLYLKSDNPEAAQAAAEILKKGGLVAIPTETVYGLAANALDGEAVKKIFEAKGRPQDNPLIVHVQSLDEIPPLVKKVDERLYDLAREFWPGPLTVIMEKSSLIPDEVSAGLDTVAVRMPSNPCAREIIAKCGFPLAAPSANASGRPSPTRAEHVIGDLGGRIDAVVDGGECDVGVESTVVTLVTDPPTLLRPGGVTPADLERVLGKIEISHAVFEKLREGEKASSPGMKYKHYAPRAQVTIIKGSFEKYEKFLKAHNEEICAVCFKGEGRYFDKSIEYGSKNSSLSQAHDLFDALRKVDETGCKKAFVRCPSSDGVGLAVFNRLIRSAAFRIIDLHIRIPVYGLTGQTGAGKSVAAEEFKKYGFSVIDTDMIAREAVEDPEIINALCESFGADIVAQGKLDRRLLAKRAFETPEKTEILNRITHPAITAASISAIHDAEKSGARAALIDAPVLFESPLTAVCDKVICICADKQTRLGRIIARDRVSEQEALLRINAQKDEEYYKSHSDIIINNVDLNDTVAQIAKTVKEELI